MTQEGERVEAYHLNHNSAQTARACELIKETPFIRIANIRTGSFKTLPRLGLGAIFRHLRANQYHMQGWW